MTNGQSARKIEEQARKLPWMRIFIIFIIPLILLGMLFKFFDSTRAAELAARPLPSPIPALSKIIGRASPEQAGVDLSVEKDHAGNFTVGGQGIYTITVANEGQTTVTGTITVMDTLPTGVLTPTAFGGSGWDSCDVQSRPVTCVYSNTAGLDPGDVLPSLLLRVNVGPAAAPSVTNTVEITHPQDTDLTNNIFLERADVVVPGQQGADLAVTKLVAPASPVEGGPITYTLVITNNGPTNATGIVLTDTLPTGITFSGSKANQGSYTGSTGAWNVGSLETQKNTSLVITGTVNLGANGVITNTTNGLSSLPADPANVNNTGTAVVRVNPTRLVGVVAVQSSGLSIASATVRMTDSANRVFTTTADATGHYTFTSQTSAPLRPGNASITASRRGYRPQTNTIPLVASQTAQLNFQLEPAADLAISKTDGRTTVAPGDTITYTVTITNNGFLTANSLVITDVLPTNVTYITDTLNLTHTTPTAGTLVWRLPSSRDLAASGTLTFRLRASVSSSAATNAQLTNTVRTSTSSIEGTTTDNAFQDTDTVSTSGVPNVTVTKTVSPASASPGGNLVFTIVVRNTGSSPATNVEVTDTFPTILDVNNSNITTNRGSATINTTSRLMTAAIGTLNTNESATINITARVNNTATSNSTQTNIATVRYTSGGTQQTRTNSVSYQIVASSTLPGTGWGPPSLPEVDRGRPVSWLSLIFAVLGLAALGAGLLVKALRKERILFLGIGLWLLLMGLVVSPVGAGWLHPRQELAQATAPFEEPAVTPVEEEAESLQIIFPTPEVIETLPDYPVPTPEITPTPGKNGEQPDSSSVERILIPALGVDTVVKYVPYDGFTWKIAGLQQEVAWMGETSWPGLGGNTALAGHVTLRDGRNGPFRYLEDLVSGDKITLFTEKGIYTYQVREQKVVGQTEVSVLKPTNSSQLTLITCTGWDPSTRFYQDRLVVMADLVGVEPRKIAARGN